MGDNDIEGPGATQGLLGKVGATGAAAASPVRRFLERRAEQRRIEVECTEIRNRVDAELRELHDRIWGEWGSQVFNSARRRLEEAGNERTQQ